MLFLYCYHDLRNEILSEHLVRFSIWPLFRNLLSSSVVCILIWTRGFFNSLLCFCDKLCCSDMCFWKFDLCNHFRKLRRDCLIMFSNGTACVFKFNGFTPFGGCCKTESSRLWKRSRHMLILWSSSTTVRNTCLSEFISNSFFFWLIKITILQVDSQTVLV